MPWKKEENLVINTDMELTTLEQLEDRYIGPRGTNRRERYEKSVMNFMIGYQIQKERKKQNLTQKELADRIGKKREFISKIENDGSNLTIKTLRDIVEKGLAGSLKIEIAV